MVEGGATCSRCGARTEWDDELDGPVLCAQCWDGQPPPIAAKQRAYYEEHRDDIAARKRAYYEEHRDDIAARKRAYREEHRDDIAARKRAYREEHRDDIAAKQRAYYEEHRPTTCRRPLCDQPLTEDRRLCAAGHKQRGRPGPDELRERELAERRQVA